MSGNIQAPFCFNKLPDHPISNYQFILSRKLVMCAV